MGDLSTNFNRSEFACGCGCGFDAVDYALLTELEAMRAAFSSPVHVNSGARCRAHNAVVGGAVNSQHLFGKGADVWVEDIPAQQVADWLDRRHPQSWGIGLYIGRVHVDCRPDRARWTAGR